ncbi:efflux RND transporter periplasmic adaptor subunit [Consotaella aegiceratis]|uniref:efflux RND transporter periplasmic adaptor subunit n=1 Tax=Consotaella aegiceratis TaxID=3097961 RepID=UPI002F40A946
MLDNAPTTDEATTDGFEPGRSVPQGSTSYADTSRPQAPSADAHGKGPQAPIEQPAPAKPKGKGRLILGLVALAALGIGGYFGHYWWTEGRFLVSTDDAYLAADMTILSPKISGYIEDVLVEDNDTVKAGQPIFRIDPGDFQLAVDSAKAKIATQRATVESIRAQRQAAEAAVAQADASEQAAEATLQQAEVTLKRAQDLLKTKVGSRATLDQAQSARDTASANLAGAKASVESAKANITTLDAQAKEAEVAIGELQVALRSAERDLSFTTITAPYDGVVGNLAVQPGDYVAAARKLAALVPLSHVYIDANLKETEVAEIGPGAKVNVEVDALPGRKFQGTVTSVSPASGAVFSLLPADNATGNFTKVVQRVPVRIDIDHAAELQGILRPGLSAVVSIDTRTVPASSSNAIALAGR